MDKESSSRPGAAPLRVIGLGLGRTGTSSMQIALQQIGFGPSYHMRTIMHGQVPVTHVDLWWKVHRGEDVPETLDEIFKDFKSVTDYPAAMYVQELYDAYPDAKFLLTVRDAERWKKSCQDTIMANWKHSMFMSMMIFPRIRKVTDWLKATMRNGYHHGTFDRDAVEQFHEHNDKVVRIIPPEKLLVYQVGKDGWGPLCEFLEVPIPTTPFPHENDSKEFQTRMRRFYIMERVLQVIAAGAVAATAYGTARYLEKI